MKIRQGDLIYSINEDEETVKLVGCQTSNSELIIPSSINHESKEYYVISISRLVFIESKHIKSVTFAPDSKFQLIEKEAFSRTSIESISIPAHVRRICDASFLFCGELRRIEIPKNSELQTIEEDAFNSSAIEKIFIPESLTNLEEGWCSNTCKLTTIEVDAKNPRYSYIENQFLVGKSDLENEDYDVLVFARRDIVKATIPPFIKIIGPYAFDNCCFEVDIPSNSKLQTISKYAFSISNIKKITISAQVTQICSCAFLDCKCLSIIEIPMNSKLQKIGKYAFSGSEIEKIFIPESLTDLEEGWCSNTGKLTTVEVDAKNPRYSYIENQFLVGKSDLENEDYDVLVFARRDIVKATIPSFIKIIDPYAFFGCNELQQIIIPQDSKLQIIGDKAFNSTGIQSIKIPAGVTQIGEFAFAFCKNLQQIHIPSDSQIQIISKNAFYRTSIQSILIPNKVTQICDESFQYCDQLQQILFYPDSQLQIIGENAFAFTKIRSISIPAHVTHIFDGAFRKCSCLKHVEIQKNSKIQKIGIDAFSGTEIERIFIPESLVDLEEGWCYNACKLTTVEVDAKNSRYSYIENQFLVGKSDLKNKDYDNLIFARHDITIVKIPPFIKTILQYVFSYHQQLKQVEIPLNSKLQMIGREAIAYTSIERISIPVHFTKIDEGAFAFCKKLRRVEIPQNSELQIIDAFAFFGSSLESILIPAHVTRMGEQSLSFCSVRIIEIDEKSEMKESISKYVENNINETLIMIPIEMVKYYDSKE